MNGKNRTSLVEFSIRFENKAENYFDINSYLEIIKKLLYAIRFFCEAFLSNFIS